MVARAAAILRWVDDFGIGLRSCPLLKACNRVVASNDMVFKTLMFPLEQIIGAVWYCAERSTEMWVQNINSAVHAALIDAD